VKENFNAFVAIGLLFICFFLFCFVVQLFPQSITPIKFMYKAEVINYCNNKGFSNFSVIEDNPLSYKIKANSDIYTFKENSFEIKVYKNDIYSFRFFVNRGFIFNGIYSKY